MTTIKQQDWEFCERFKRGDDWEYETINIQIPTKREALKRARRHARKTGNTCFVWTTNAIIDTKRNSVEDRDLVPDFEPIEVSP